MKNELDSLLERQHLIIGYNKQKLEIVNHIIDGYNRNDRALTSHFMLFTAHVFYRSVVIDLCALYGNGGTHKNNFSLLYSNKDVLKHLKPEIPSMIRKMIKPHLSAIKRILDLRNSEFAHYDFEPLPAIRMNFDELTTVNDLFETAKTILVTCGSEKLEEKEASHYDLSDRGYLDSLIRLLK